MPNYQGVWSLSTQYQNRTGWPTFVPTQGILAGGIQANNTIIDFFNMDTAGNASDWGNLSSGRYGLGAVGNATRVAWGGGIVGATAQNTIDYITWATQANAVDFGDLNKALGYLAGLSNSTRGVWGGGYDQSADAHNNMQYITIASTGNASNFGDLTRYGYGLGGTSSGHGGLS